MSMTKTERKLATCFVMLDGVYWGIMASFGAFLVAWMLDRSDTQSFVSVMLMIYFVCGFFGQFILSSLCDYLHTNKVIFIIGIMLTGMVQVGMYFTGNSIAFAFLYGCYGFVLGPMGSILDAWMLRSFGNVKTYSSARGAGSLGYAVIMLIMGQLIRKFGYWLMLPCSTLMVLLTLLLAITIPDGQFTAATGKRDSAVSLHGVLSIIKIPAFVAILVVLLLTSMSSAPINNFKIMLLRSVGGNVATQGLDSFVGCIIQFCVFELAVVLIRIPAWTRFSIGVLLTAAACILYYNASHCWIVIVGTMLTNISYGLIVLAGRELATQAVAPQYHTTAVGVMDAFYSFLGGAIAQIYAGRVVERYGIRTMILLSLLLSVVPLAIVCMQVCLKWRLQKNCLA